MDFGGLFGAIGSIVGGAMQASAIKKATEMLIKALERQRDFVYANLKPARVQAEAQAADVERAQASLALQSQIDPAWLAARYVSQEKLLQLAKEGAESTGDKLAAHLFEEAAAPENRAKELSQKLMDRELFDICRNSSSKSTQKAPAGSDFLLHSVIDWSTGPSEGGGT